RQHRLPGYVLGKNLNLSLCPQSFRSGGNSILHALLLFLKQKVLLNLLPDSEVAARCNWIAQRQQFWRPLVGNPHYVIPEPGLKYIGDCAIGKGKNSIYKGLTKQLGCSLLAAREESEIATRVCGIVNRRLHERIECRNSAT